MALAGGPCSDIVHVKIAYLGGSPHHTDMKTIATGSVLGIRELTERQRNELRAALAWLETDLVRRRKRLAYWTMRKVHAETLPAIPERLRADTLHFHARSQELVASGERLRAYLVAELQDQPEHLPAYHYAH